MAHQDKPLPEYRKHDSRHVAVVTIDGMDFELGKYGSAASRNRYDRLVTEWVANGRALPSALANKTLTVKKLVATFRGFAKQYYRGSTEVVNLEHCMKPLVDLYGSLPASDFGPLKLKAVRQKMIEADICRAEINKRTGRIKRIFRWATENELLSPTVFHSLQSVRGLARGRTEARASEPVRPVPEAFADALKPCVPPQIWAMIELQQLTGMRPQVKSPSCGPAISTPADGFGSTYPLITRLRTTALAVRFTLDRVHRKYCLATNGSGIG